MSRTAQLPWRSCMHSGINQYHDGYKKEEEQQCQISITNHGASQAWCSRDVRFVGSVLWSTAMMDTTRPLISSSQLGCELGYPTPWWLVSASEQKAPGWSGTQGRAENGQSKRARRHCWRLGLSSTSRSTRSRWRAGTTQPISLVKVTTPGRIPVPGESLPLPGEAVSMTWDGVSWA